MNITIEKIDELIERKNVSYEEAKKALEQADGDLLEAIIILEKEPKEKKEEPKAETTVDAEEKKEKTSSGDRTDLEDLFKSFFKYSIILKKNGQDKFHIPIWLILIVGMFEFPIVIIALLIAVITKHKIVFSKENS